MDTVILIGNTNTRIVWLTKRSIQKVTTVKTQGLEMVIPKMTFEKVGCVFVASVVPDATSVVKKFIPDIRQITWKDFPKKIKVKEPQKVGIDRLLNAIGGWSLAKTECLIIDAGSAITIDLVNKNGDFEGGVIFPGEKLIVESLKNLALLKNIKVSKPASLLGKNTSEAIGSGIFFGLSFLISGYIDFFRKKNPNLVIFFTGGSGKGICQTTKIGCYNKNLGIIGIQAIIYGCS